jgi:hypothetical protein
LGASKFLTVENILAVTQRMVSSFPFFLKGYAESGFWLRICFNSGKGFFWVKQKPAKHMVSRRAGVIM